MTAAPPDGRGEVLLALARAAIDAALEGPPLPPTSPEPWLAAPGACFVTLKQDGQLRGCIGNIVAQGSLRDAIVRNAQSSALRDLASARSPARARRTNRDPLLSRSSDARGQRWRRARRLLPAGAACADPPGRSAVVIPSVGEQLPDPRAFSITARQGQLPPNAGCLAPSPSAHRPSTGRSSREDHARSQPPPLGAQATHGRIQAICPARVTLQDGRGVCFVRQRAGEQ